MTPGTCLIWAKSWLGRGSQGRTQAPASCLHLWAGPWAPTAGSQATLGLRRLPGGGGRGLHQGGCGACPVFLHPFSPWLSSSWVPGPQLAECGCDPPTPALSLPPGTHTARALLWLQKMAPLGIPEFPLQPEDLPAHVDSAQGCGEGGEHLASAAHHQLAPGASALCTKQGSGIFSRVPSAQGRALSITHLPTARLGRNCVPLRRGVGGRKEWEDQVPEGEEGLPSLLL